MKYIEMFPHRLGRADNGVEPRLGRLVTSLYEIHSNRLLDVNSPCYMSNLAPLQAIAHDLMKNISLNI